MAGISPKNLGWANQIASDYKLIPLGRLVRLRSEKNDPIKETQILSLTADRGVILYEEKGSVGNQASEDISRYSIVRTGDIVVNSMNVIIGSVGLSKYNGVLSPVYYVLTPINPSMIDMRYLAYHFQIKSFQQGLVRIGYGILDHRMRIPWINLAAELIVVPPIEEQHKIANYLDGETKRIDSLIDAKNKQIMLYLSALDSKKNQILWEDNNERLIPLGYLVKCNQRSLGNETDPDFRFAYCDVGSVNFRTGISLDIESFSFAEAPSRARRLAQAGDVVFSMVRPYLRAVAKVPKFDRQLVFSTAFAVLEPVEISADYLFEVLSTSKFLSEAESWSTGMSYPAINQETLLKIKVPYLDSGMQHKKITDLSEQRASTIQLIEKVEQSIRALVEYKTAVIAAAVSGKHSKIAGRSMDS